MSIQEQVADAWENCLREYAVCLVYDMFEKDPSEISKMGHSSSGFLHGISDSRKKVTWYSPPAPPEGHHHNYVVEGYNDALGVDRELHLLTGQDVFDLDYAPFDVRSWRKSRIQKTSHQLFPTP